MRTPHIIVFTLDRAVRCNMEGSRGHTFDLTDLNLVFAVTAQAPEDDTAMFDGERLLHVDSPSCAPHSAGHLAAWSGKATCCHSGA